MPGFKIFNSHHIMLVFCEFIIVQGNIGVTKREKLTNYTLFLSTLGAIRIGAGAVRKYQSQGPWAHNREKIIETEAVKE